MTYVVEINLPVYIQIDAPDEESAYKIARDCYLKDQKDRDRAEIKVAKNV